MTNFTKFWMVMGEGPSTVRHATRGDADLQARRLAHRYPGKTFVVLEAQATTLVSGGIAEVLPCLPPVMSPQDYEPLENVNWPMGFILFTPAGEQDCPSYAVAHCERELANLLYRYAPPQLARVPVESLPECYNECSCVWGLAVADFDAEEGFPADFDAVVSRRRTVVPRLSYRSALHAGAQAGGQ